VGAKDIPKCALWKVRNVGYHIKSAPNDFDAFSRQFGLPTIAGGCRCFRQVDHNGGMHYPPPPPAGDTTSAFETDLDIEWAHAIAPGAKILLVEATDFTLDNMMVAENYATAHAQVVSNSWGGAEGANELSYDSHFNKPVAITFGAGDSGTPAYYPSASPYVLSVGGTTLSINGLAPFGGCWIGGCTYGGESIWNDNRPGHIGGGGASAYESRPMYQFGYCGTTANVNDCGMWRGTPDVSWEAGGPGVAVFDSAGVDFDKGWTTAVGTSVGAPSVAGLIALADQVNHTVLTTNNLATRFAYQSAGAFDIYGNTYHDIMSGSNGTPCCTAGNGYDLASGLGSPTGAAWIHAAVPSWKVVPSANAAGVDTLYAASALSASDIWGVGTYEINSNNWNTMIEHWDGTSWKVVPSPNVGTGLNFLQGVTAVSSTDEPVEKCRCGGSSLGVEDALRADVLASISLDAAMR
jgi:subtilase family serine protease